MTDKLQQQIDRVLGFVKANGCLSDRLAADEVREYLAARTGGEVEPIGWVWESYNQTNFTAGSHHKELLEADGVQLTPVYTRPAPAAAVPDGWREKLEHALGVIHDALQESYQNAYPTCCGRAGHECCGSPEPDWSKEDQVIMDALAPASRVISDLLTATPQPVVESEKPRTLSNSRAPDKSKGEGMPDSVAAVKLSDMTLSLALATLRDNVRDKERGVKYQGLRDNDMVRDALAVLLSAQPPEGER